MQPEAQSPTSNSEGGQDEVVQTGVAARSREPSSLKRGREGSLEPYPLTGLPTLAPIVSKKNRLATSSTNPNANPSSTPVTAEPGQSSKEANNVGEVRRKVEKMNWKEGEVRPEGYDSIEEDVASEVVEVEGTKSKQEGRGTVEEDSMALSVKGDDDDDPAVAEGEWEQVDATEVADQPTVAGGGDEHIDTEQEDEGSHEKGSEGLKRKVLDRSQSSTLAIESTTDAKRLKDETTEETPIPQDSVTETTAPPAALVKKPQASFSSFSSAASPFAKIGASSPTIFGAPSSNKTFASSQSGFSNTKSTSPLGDIKSPSPAPPLPEAVVPSSSATSSADVKVPVLPPSSLTSTTTAAIPNKPTPLTANHTFSSTPVKSTFSGSGFGAYTSTASPFASKSSSKIQTSTDEEKEDRSGGAGPSKSFGDILQGSGEGVEDEKEKVQMTEQDLHTGEEDESTVYQSRVKLYVMQSDGGWRERGVGTLRLNVRRSDGRGARLVMRAEGVLRLILNVSLYVGMPCLEDGKHVRMTVFEEKERRFITFRTGSQKAATELTQTILAHLPEDNLPLPTSSTNSEAFTSPREPSSATGNDNDHDEDADVERKEKEGVVERKEREQDEEEEDESLRRAEEGDGGKDEEDDD